MIVIKTITGLADDSFDVFNINIVDENVLNGAITANLTNGGDTKVTYGEFFPALEEGEIIYVHSIPLGTANIVFSKYYPFAKYENVITPTEPDVPGIVINSIDVTNQTQIGVNDGSAEINATGGTPPYEYSLNGADWFDANIFINLSVGDYLATVRSKSNTEQRTSLSFTISPAVAPPDPPQQPPVKDCIPIEDAEILINDAFKRVRVKTIFGKAPSLLSNGNFEVYDGQNWPFWVKYGGINVSRIQRTIIDSSGNMVPLDNYALQFNEKAVDVKYIQHSPIAVNFGDTIKLGYRVGKTPGTGVVRGTHKVGFINIPANYETVYISKVRITCGSLFLYNADYGSTYEWLPQVATVGHKVDNPQGDLSTYSISIGIPPCPQTGDLTIQFFGFVKTQIISPAITAAEGDPLTFKTIINELNEYEPIAIDDVTASKTSQDADNDIDSMLSISDNLRFFSQTPDTFEIMFGDLFYRNRYQADLDNLYAIKYDGEFTNGWTEYGVGNSAAMPFGMGLAKSILTAYQKPFKKWYGGLKTAPESNREFSYLDLFSFIVTNSTFYQERYFEVLGIEINIKDNTVSNVVLAESFNKVAKSNDTTVPSYPNMPEPNFTQDPNANDNIGIFTEEFTEQFT